MKEPNDNKGQFDNFDERYAPSDGRPLSRILQEIVNHVTEMIRAEVRLARVEVRQDLTQVAKASVFIVIGAVCAIYAFGFILLGVVYALGTTILPWLSAVLGGVGVAIVGAFFVQVGRKKIKQTNLTPETTIRSLQENVTWMKKQTK